MKNDVEKVIWLSFDLGVGGDYPNLYKWLDNHAAIECGESVAFFRYSINQSDGNDIAEIIKKDIKKNVKLRPGDRIYVVRRELNTMKGTFIFGKRKASPWQGYGDDDSSSSDSEE